MKQKIIVIMCSILFAIPVLSFAIGKNDLRPNKSAYEHANENAKFEREQDFFNQKVKEEIRAKKLAEKELRKATRAKKKAQALQKKRAWQLKKNGLNSNATSDDQANKNAKFKRSNEVFNNKETKKIRTEMKVEKDVSETAEEKKKEEEAQDDGYGQFDIKF